LTDKHFEAATKTAPSAAQKAAHSAADSVGSEKIGDESEKPSRAKNPCFSDEIITLPLSATPIIFGDLGKVGGEGLEPLAESSGNTPISAENSANCSAPCARSGPIDPRLAAIVEAWPTLPEGVRAKLGALVAEAEQR